MEDITSGNMANFTHVDVGSAPNGASEHPPNGPCTGENFTVADAYLYVTLSWLGRLQIDISHLPKLAAYFERCRDRPSVQKARTEEGLPAK